MPSRGRRAQGRVGTAAAVRIIQGGPSGDCRTPREPGSRRRGTTSQQRTHPERLEELGDVRSSPAV